MSRKEQKAELIFCSGIYELREFAAPSAGSLFPRSSQLGLFFFSQVSAQMSPQTDVL